MISLNENLRHQYKTVWTC